MICAECGGELESSFAPIEDTFKGTRVVVENVGHLVCGMCGEAFFMGEQADEYAAALDSGYRRANGLLSPDEIKGIRKRLGMSQEEFQALLGVGKTTVSRWESGRVIQPKAEDNLMRLVDARRENVDILRRRLDERFAFSGSVHLRSRSQGAGFKLASKE